MTTNKDLRHITKKTISVPHSFPTAEVTHTHTHTLLLCSSPPVGVKQLLIS